MDVPLCGSIKNRHYDIANKTSFVINSTNYSYTADKNVLLVINSNSNVNSYIYGSLEPDVSNNGCLMVTHTVNGYGGVNDKIELHAGETIYFITDSANAWKGTVIPIV